MTRRNLLKVVPVLLVAAACDDGTGPSPAELEGTWTATRIEFVMAANAATRVDIVPLGGSATLVLSAGKTFQFTIINPGEAPFTASGTWSASVDVLTLTFSTGLQGTMEFDMSLNGNALTLSGGGSEYDFDDDGETEDARLNLGLTRS